MKGEIQPNNLDFERITHLTEEARNRAFYKVNEELVLLYFNVGKVVSERVSVGNWGDKTVDELARFIEVKYPEMKGFNRRGLFRMKQFYETYSTPEIVSTLVTLLQSAENKNDKIVSALPTLFTNNKITREKVSAVPTQMNESNIKAVLTLLTKVTWTNHLEILSQTKSPEEKLFYLLECVNEKWSMRELKRQLTTGFYERTMLSSKIVSKLQTQFPSDLFKDPYIFEFLDLPDIHTEQDFENAIVRNLQKFILEIGKSFTYMGNQYRLQVGNKDYYTDLLFYHRNYNHWYYSNLKFKSLNLNFWVN